MMRPRRARTRSRLERLQPVGAWLPLVVLLLLSLDFFGSSSSSNHVAFALPCTDNATATFNFNKSLVKDLSSFARIDDGKGSKVTLSWNVPAKAYGPTVGADHDDGAISIAVGGTAHLGFSVQ